tara:strand:- start:194 stop:370 length:177 start_codon:yes stop_codon:yes gene_type:complete
MNGALMFCEILASWTIIGAVETSPGWMKIDYLDHNQNADFIVIDRAFYEECETTEELQ